MENCALKWTLNILLLTWINAVMTHNNWEGMYFYRWIHYLSDKMIPWSCHALAIFSRIDFHVWNITLESPYLLWCWKMFSKGLLMEVWEMHYVKLLTLHMLNYTINSLIWTLEIYHHSRLEMILTNDPNLKLYGLNWKMLIKATFNIKWEYALIPNGMGV